MSYAIVAFIAADDARPIDTDAAEQALARDVPGSRLGARSVDRRDFRFHFAIGETPELQQGDEPLPWRAIVLAELAEPTGLARARGAQKTLHDALRPEATVLVLGHEHGRGRRVVGGGAYTIAVQRRKAGLSKDEFIRYYEDVYVPNATAAVDDPPYDSYTTSVVLDVLGDFAWDGVTFNEYGSPEVLRAHVRAQISEVTRRTTSSDFLEVVQKFTGTRLVGVGAKT